MFWDGIQKTVEMWSCFVVSPSVSVDKSFRTQPFGIVKTLGAGYRLCTLGLSHADLLIPSMVHPCAAGEAVAAFW